MAIFAHFLLFLLQYSLFIGTIIDFMLNNVKYNYTDAFLYFFYFLILQELKYMDFNDVHIMQLRREVEFLGNE